MVEGRFCFEGGSRCGRGEGLYVLMTDQGPDMARAFQLAAEGRLHSRRRHLSRNGTNLPTIIPNCNPCMACKEALVVEIG